MRRQSQARRSRRRMLAVLLVVPGAAIAELRGEALGEPPADAGAPVRSDAGAQVRSDAGAQVRSETGRSPARARVAHVDLSLLHRDGTLSFDRMARGEHVEEEPRASRKRRFDVRGRFEVRVLIDGKSTGEPVRFDFPLLAEADAGEAQVLDEKMRAHVTCHASVRVPLPTPFPPGVVEFVVSDSRSSRTLRIPLPEAAERRAP